MRRLAPWVLLVLSLGLVGAHSLRWGVTATYLRTNARETDQPARYDSVPRINTSDGWTNGTRGEYLFPGWIGAWIMPHFWVLITAGLATFFILLHGRGVRVPVSLPVWLTFYALYHSALTVLFYETNHGDRISNDRIESYAGAGAWLATALGLVAFVTALLWARAMQREAPPAT